VDLFRYRQEIWSTVLSEAVVAQEALVEVVVVEVVARLSVPSYTNEG
jgi:hypothetical protein